MTDRKPKYPDVIVELVGHDGNALSVISQCNMVAQRHGISLEELQLFQREALSGDYDNVLQTCSSWFMIV